MTETFEARYEAVRSRDPRFDGRFYTAVSSTGIYCRPSCPARTPYAANVTFYPSAPAAQAAGFRACKRCRPEASPGSPDWNARAGIVDRALRLISDGVADEVGVAGVAARLAVSERHLHRLMTAELGVGPAAYARARRAQSARLLLDSTQLGITEIAFAAGFSSIRQFNETMSAIFGCPPRELRRRRLAGAESHRGELVVRLDYRAPLAAPELLTFLRGRCVAGIEECDGDAYRRTLRLAHGAAVMKVTFPSHVAHAAVRLRLADLRDLTAAVQRCRRIFDLDADPVAIGESLRHDPRLEPLLRRTPGLRVPGSADGFELAVRAILGQQVTVAGARTLAGRLASKLGSASAIADPTLTSLFPTASAVAADDLGGLGLTGARVTALRALAGAVLDGGLQLDPGADRQQTRSKLLALPGIGAWTADYIAMRALADPDAFPAGDLGLRQAWQQLGGGVADLAAASERWRPWRAYAALHLWNATAANALTGEPSPTAKITRRSIVRPRTPSAGIATVSVALAPYGD